ncbi:hypothetical protein D3C74_444680 [compost metagenome]
MIRQLRKGNLVCLTDFAYGPIPLNCIWRHVPMDDNLIDLAFKFVQDKINHFSRFAISNMQFSFGFKILPA